MRHPTEVARDLGKLKDRCPDQAALIEEAVSALFRQAATIASVKAAIKP